MTITSRNPHDPADLIGEWQPATEAEVAAAVDRAAAAARGWADTPARPGRQRCPPWPTRWRSGPLP